MKNLVPVEALISKIVLIRGEKVMIDRDLAELYGVQTKVLKQAVRRNIDRFPDDFMFELTRDEHQLLRSQFGILKQGAHSKYPPMAFTEQGVAMLSSVLNSQRAIEVNIAIMRAFVHLRKMVINRKELARKLKKIEQHLKGHDEQIQAIFEVIKGMLELEAKPKKKIGFTVKEKTKAHGKPKAGSAADDFSLTSMARKIWKSIPGNVQLKILNNVWCSSCMGGSSIAVANGKVERGMLILHGTCTRCGSPVARVIEND